MNDDIGYPTTTNRAGNWAPSPREQHAAALARRRADPNQHLDEILRPIKDKGIHNLRLLGMETETDKLRDLVYYSQDDGPENLRKLGIAIYKAITASMMSHPHFVNTDPSESTISAAETKRRYQWCVKIAQQCRFDMKWSLSRICEKLPHLLGHYLDGNWETHLHEKRRFFAKGKVPVRLAEVQARRDKEEANQ